jgi:membrane protease YdiL (CAAX protease family)/DNA-binding XRE family transcriptional regulator
MTDAIVKLYVVRTSWQFWGYLVLITIAETITAVWSPLAGVILHILLLLALVTHGALAPREAERKLALALTLAPLIRLLSLSLPLTRMPQIGWYPVVAIPLLLACWMIIGQNKMSRRELGLFSIDLVVEPLLMFGGLGLGAIEYAILRPTPLFQTFSWGMFMVAALTLTLSTGLPEELIFRGMLQRLALPTLGRWAIMYVALLFTAMHIGYKSILDVLFVFAVGMMFGKIVRRSGSIVGVTLAHGTTNITLFLIMPHLVASQAGPNISETIWMALLGAQLWGGVLGILMLHSWNQRHQPRAVSQALGNMRSLRRASGLTYTELARRTGLSARALAEIEHGLSPVAPQQANSIAQVLGVSVQVLATSAVG